MSNDTGSFNLEAKIATFAVIIKRNTEYSTQQLVCIRMTLRIERKRDHPRVPPLKQAELDPPLKLIILFFIHVDKVPTS